jgi:hypothetical protein
VERPAAKQRSYVAADTKGQSVAAFFQALVAARPPSGSAESGGLGGAQDGTSPGSVLGEESPTAPAVPAKEQKTDAAVSFDDFFESEADGSKALRQQSPDPGKNDLDQFQTWLQNLKP